MSGIGTTIVFAVAATNPAYVTMLLKGRRRPLDLVGGAVAAVGVAAALAGLSDPILDALAVNLGTFELGAAVVVGAIGARQLVGTLPRPFPPSDTPVVGLVPVAFPAMLRPGLAAVAVSSGAAAGTVAVLAGAAVACGLAAAAVLARARGAALGGAARLLGALAVIVAVALGVDGVKTL